MWSIATLVQQVYGRDSNQGHGFSGDWVAEWNPQGTQLLSGDFWWNAEAQETPSTQYSGGTIPNNIFAFINPMWFDGYTKPRYQASWNPSGSKIAYAPIFTSNSSDYKLSILNTLDKSINNIFLGIHLNQINWISDNKILVKFNKTSPLGYGEDFIELINVDTETVEYSVKFYDFIAQNNLSYTDLHIDNLSPDRKKLYCLCQDNQNKNIIAFFDSTNLVFLNQIVVDSRPSKLQWFPNSKMIAVQFQDGTIRIIDSETGEVTRVINNFQNFPYDSQVREFQFSRDGNLLVILNNKGEPILFDAKTLEIMACISCTATKHSANIYQITISPNQKTVSSVSRDRTVMTRDLKTGVANSSQQLGSQSVYAIGYSPDSTAYATAGEDSIIHLWNAGTREEIGTLSGHTYTIRGLAWKPNSTTLASAGWDNTLRIWNTATQTLEQTQTDHTDYVNAVQYNPSGTALASASSDGTIKLRNPDTGETQFTLQPVDSSRPVFTIAYSSDGTRLASGSEDHQVRIWNTATQTLEATLKGHLGAVRTMAWLNSTTLVTGGMDGRIILWDVPNQKMMLEVEPQLGAVFALTASSDGQQFYAGFDSGNIASWKVTP